MDEQKYIRTLEGDMETVKKGGTPDLMPLRPAGPESGDSEEKNDLSEEPKSVPLKTYADDFSQRMKETQASTATVLASEQDSMRLRTESPPQTTSRSNIIYSIAGGVLLIAGMVGAYVAYTAYLGSSEPIAVAPAVAAPIFVDDREQVSGTDTALLQAIEQSVARLINKGTIRLLYLETPAPAASVFSALALPVPGGLLRNINAAQSMAGVVNVSGKQSPFFVLSVSYYGETFASMLQWESLMPRDLARLFPSYPAPIVTIPIATSTQKIATTTPIAPQKPAAFFDIVIANHDVRAYRDSSGRDILLYGYWNQTTLVIARDASAFIEIIGRLATSRTP